jgi:SAM-dependent methyltransferase
MVIKTDYEAANVVAAFAGCGEETEGEKAFLSQFLLGFIPANRSETIQVLDMGCGTGWLFHKLAEAHHITYTGYDISQKMIEAAQAALRPGSTANASAAYFTSRKEELSNARYDVCYAIFLLPALETKREVAELFELISRLAKPLARVVIVVCNPDNLCGPHAYYAVSESDREYRDGDVYTTVLATGSGPVTLHDRFWSRTAIVQEAFKTDLSLISTTELFTSPNPAPDALNGCYLILTFTKNL